MRALWPDSIDPSKLLPHIGPFRNPNLFGSYRRFISDELAPSLSPQQVPQALRWARGRSESSFDIEAFDIAPRIVARALDCMDASGVLEELTQTALWLLSNDRDLLPEALPGGDSNPLNDDAVRQRLLLALLAWIQDFGLDSWHLTHTPRHGPAILQSGDVPWLLDLAGQAASPTTRWTLARLIQACWRPEPADSILEACSDNDVLRRALPEFCGTVWLGSRRAKAARERLIRRRERDAKRLYPPPVPSPQGRIAATLARIDAGNANAFVRLAHDLTLAHDGRYVRIDSADLRQTPGWQGADPATRAKIVAAAARYLREGNPKHDKLVEIGQPLDSTVAATCALHLFASEASTVGLPDCEPDWHRWA